MWNTTEMSQLDAALTGVPLTLNFQSQIVSREWEARLSWNKRDGDRMPWCGTLRKWVKWTLHWLGYLWPWILMVKLCLGNGRPDCHRTKGTGVDSMSWCKTQQLCDLESYDIYCYGPGWLKMSAFPSTRLVATDDGLSPVQCQPLIWTNAGILLIGS